jgi:hypothetical protein
VKVALEGSLTKRVMCKRCKSELDYEPADVKSTVYEDSGIKYHVHCPLCEEKLGINFSFVAVDPPDQAVKKKKTTGTTFKLSIDVFTRDVRDAGDVAQALRSVADRLGKFTSQPWSPYALDGKIFAADGSKRQIGTWRLEPEADIGLTITAENDPDSRVHCSRCGQYIRDVNKDAAEVALAAGGTFLCATCSPAKGKEMRP